MTEAQHLDLGAYVSGRLDPDDRLRFERHLETCRQCADELPRLQGVAAAVSDAVAPLEPPASLEARVIAAVERDAAPSAPPKPARTERVRRPLGLLGLAGATAVAAIAIAAVIVRGGDGPGVLEFRAVLSAPQGTSEASVEVRRTGIGRVVTFESDLLPILPRGDYYELWFVGPGDRPARPNRISAGTFHPDEEGNSDVRFAAAVDPALYPVLSVTAEPGDGDPRPTGPEVLRVER